MKISQFSAKIFIIISISSAAFTGSAYADEINTSQMTLTLTEALELAMTGNSEIRAMDKALLATNEDIGIAGSYLLPKLNFEERFMRTNTPAYAFSFKMNQERFSALDLMGAPDTFNHPSPISDFQTTLSFEQPLFAPKAYIGIDMAKKETSAKTKEFERKKEEIALKVYKAYLGVGTAQAYLSTAEKAIEDFNLHLRVAEFRYKEGLGIYSDVLRAKVALSMATERKVSAKKNLDTAKRALGLMLGLTESVEIINNKNDIEIKDINYYYGSANSRKDLRAMESRVNNAGNMIKMANAGYLPVIGVGAAYQMNDHQRPFGAEGESWQMMAFLRWELFDGTKREHERQKAKYKVGEAEEYLSGMKKEIAFNIYDAYLGVDEARESRDLAKAALLSAEEGVRIVNLRYENSLSSMVELLDMQTGLDVTRTSLVEKESAYQIAAANLWFQSGTILKELRLEQ